MKRISIFNLFILILLLGAAATSARAAGTPPYSGTAFIDPDIVTPSDPSLFVEAPYAGRGLRTMYDRRVDGWITVKAYLFNASYTDGSKIEIQVNPEYGSVGDANTPAQDYGWLVGQLPAVLRKDIKKLWIHKGNEDFGGGNNSLMIYPERGVDYGDNIEEILFHESAHTSLDADHADAPKWLDAQTADGTFISAYAQDYPDREDIAESFLVYFAVRYRADRISATDANTILATIPNRIAYFDSKHFDMYPTAPFLNAASQRNFDGWILESDENSGLGGSMDAAAANFRLGDDAANRQFRGLLHFNTALLPNNAVITRVTLKLKIAGVTGSGNPVTTFQGFMVDIQRGFFGTSALQLGDFNASAHKVVGPLTLSPAGGWYNLNISAGKNFINRLGATQIRLRFKLGDNNNAIANYLTLYSGNSGAAICPQLIVQYYTP